VEKAIREGLLSIDEGNAMFSDMIESLGVISLLLKPWMS